MTATKEAAVSEIPAGLPAAADLAQAARDAIEAGRDPSKALDAYAPAIDTLADAGTLAAWLGMSRASVYQERSRVNADGTPRWPAADETGGRSGLWRLRTVILHRATMPGQGSAGRGRPRKLAGQAPGAA
jgi:hypothetical protein